MASIMINKTGEVSVYEYKSDRSESCCMCKYDIIYLPENVFSVEFIEKLKRTKGPIDLNELKTKDYECFNQKSLSMV